MTEPSARDLERAGNVVDWMENDWSNAVQLVAQALADEREWIITPFLTREHQSRKQIAALLRIGEHSKNEATA
jgi:hypothetical protein